MSLKSLAVNARGEIEFHSRRDNKGRILDRLFLDYMDCYRERRLQVRAHNENLPRKAEKLPSPVGFSQSELNAAFNDYMGTQADAAFERLKTLIAYSPKIEAEEHVEKVMRIFLNQEPTSLDVAVFKHMFWQVKQRMWNKPARHELIISFFGKQGAGKTTLARQLGSPIKDLFVERSMREIIGDERNNFMLQKAYLLLFEELENASKVDIDSLKAVTSKDRTNWRMLGKNADDNGFNNTTFLCTSNKPIRQVFYDPTGMRRFYEYTCADEIPRRQINSVDFTKLWQSVDEAAPSPIEDRLKDLYTHQNTYYRQQGTVESFIEDLGLEKTNEDGATLKKLYEDYKSFCDQAGIKSPLSRNNFSNELVLMGFTRKRLSTGVIFNIVKGTNSPNPPNKVLKLPSVK
jgi:Cdc6-like AAA superfamily ATPase